MKHRANPEFISAGIDAVSKLSERVMQLNLAPQFAVDDKIWPPYKLKIYIPLLLIHYSGQRNIKQANAVAVLMSGGKMDDIPSMANDQLIPTHHCKQDSSHESLKEVFDNSTITKEIGDILAVLENKELSCFVLTEGPPGIGKSVLLKEISNRWAKKQLLQTYKLVLLLCLRDPMIQQAESIDDLLHLYCKGDKRASDIVSACSDQLFSNGGKDVTLLLDGFDELPEELQKNGLIADILKREVLPQCGLVLSSRPHASKFFHSEATLIVEILGFTEENRRHCIEQAFQGKPQKIKELSQYLDDHLTINSLCFVPFNMIVLLFLHEQGFSLPKNSTDMYNHFICLTICRYLARSGYSLTNTITDLTNLPEPCNIIIEQLSTLSLNGLEDDKLVFTLDEIKAVCPDIEDIPGAINGFGLLQAVQHIGLTGKTLTFNFIHFSIQEYLAAYCITKLPSLKELQILEENFWVDNYLNTFTIYLALTKGQRPSFKNFISDGNNTISISQRFLDDQGFCFYLYHCFYEAGDKKMCESIAKAKIFNNKIIHKEYAGLPNYMECLTLFLTTSFHRSWVEIHLDYTQDYGFHILHRGLKSSRITITELWLWHCDLTSSSSALVSDIAINLQVKKLVLDNNETIGENEQLYSMLSHPTTTLEILSMYKIKLSSRAANILFTVLEQNSILKILSIEGNNITDDTCPFIANAIKLNSCLVKLWMGFNPISAEAIELILEALQFNNTLKILRIPDYPDNVKTNIKLTEEKLNKMKRNHEFHIKFFMDFKEKGDRLDWI